MYESFTDPAYRSATFVGCLLMVFQQLSGINVLIFYSANIFIQLGKSGAVGASIVNFANFVGALVGMALLTKFGRKTLLISTMFFMTACMIGMGIVYNQSLSCVDPTVDCPSASLEVYFCVGFVFFFELGLGVIPWLYMAEIMTNSGMGAGVLTN